MKKYIAFILAAMAVSLVSVSCSNDDESDYTEEVSAKNKLQGEAFLANNRTANGVNETYTGLQYKIDSLGTGIKPDANDSVTIAYVAMLSTGTVFENGTHKFEVEELIKGMSEGLQLMPEGSVFHLYIPYYLAYGRENKSVYYGGKVINVAPYSMLHYYISLKKVVAVDDAPEI